MALLNFNANDVEPSSFEPIPAGWYNAIITESDWCATKDGKGRYIKFKFQIIDGEFANRTLFLNLNMENQNQQTVDIARQQLSGICHAVNVLQPQDTVELHNLPLAIKLNVKKDTNTGDLRNNFCGFREKMQIEVIPASTVVTQAPPCARG